MSAAHGPQAEARLQPHNECTVIMAAARARVNCGSLLGHTDPLPLTEPLADQGGLEPWTE